MSRTRRRRVTLPESINQVETSTGDSGAAVQRYRRSTVNSINSYKPNCVPKPPRRVCRPDRKRFEPIAIVYGTPETAGRSKRHFEFHHGHSIAVGEFGEPIGASLGLDGGAVAGTATEHDDAGHSTLRSNAEQDLNISVGQANAALTQIAQLNTQLQGLPPNDPPPNASGSTRPRDR